MCVTCWVDAHRENAELKFIEEVLVPAPIEQKVGIVLNGVIKNTHKQEPITLNLVHRRAISVKDASRKWKEDKEEVFYNNLFSGIGLEFSEKGEKIPRFKIEGDKVRIKPIKGVDYFEAAESKDLTLNVFPELGKTDLRYIPFTNMSIGPIPAQTCYAFRLYFDIVGESYETLCYQAGNKTRLIIEGPDTIQNLIKTEELIRMQSENGSAKDSTKLIQVFKNVVSKQVVPQYYNVIIIEPKNQMLFIEKGVDNRVFYGRIRIKSGLTSSQIIRCHFFSYNADKQNILNFQIVYLVL